MVMICICFLLRFVNDAIFMFRRAIEAVQFEWALFAAVKDIVRSAGRNDHRNAVAHCMLFSVQDHRSLALFEANKLIQLMDLFSDFFAGLEVHQHRL